MKKLTLLTLLILSEIQLLCLNIQQKNITLFQCLVRLWAMNSYTNRVSYIGHNYPVWHVDLSNMDVYFVSASMDQTARLWNLEYNYPLRIFSGHTSSVDVSMDMSSGFLHLMFLLCCFFT